MDHNKERRYRIDDNCQGFAECRNHCWNFSIVSRSSPDELQNEYLAGFVQGKLQRTDMIKAARNNTWKNSYLCDTSHSFPHELPPPEADLSKAEKALQENYQFTTGWIRQNTGNRCAKGILRLFYRMWGVYDALTCENPRTLSEVEESVFAGRDFKLRYGEDDITFADIYFINTQMDLMDAVANSLESSYGLYKSDHCSAFVKRTEEDDVVWTHNSWCGFLSQSHALNYLVGQDFISQNTYCFGQVGSNMDFGFNGHGICFNETTHRYSTGKPKVDGVWLCWRSAAAEMFSASIDEFYEYLSADNTGTYLNGYMLVDSDTRETALIEMSYNRFIKFKYDKDGKFSASDSTGEPVNEKLDYDSHLITSDYILGVNYPVSKKVAYELSSTDNRPMRRVQFFDRIGGVKDLETAKELITYVEDKEPLSVFGRWDLGRGTTEYPKCIPDGSVDAKAFSLKKVREIKQALEDGVAVDENGGIQSFWMYYGTPKIEGKPFVWSDSAWKDYKEPEPVDFVPDRLESEWQTISLHLRPEDEMESKARKLATLLKNMETDRTADMTVFHGCLALWQYPRVACLQTGKGNFEATEIGRDFNQICSVLIHRFFPECFPDATKLPENKVLFSDILNFKNKLTNCNNPDCIKKGFAAKSQRCFEYLEENTKVDVFDAVIKWLYEQDNLKQHN